MSRAIYFAALAAAFALAGCEDKKPAAPAAPPGGTSAPAAAQDDVPTEEDFEEEAEKEITEANLDGELDKLEKEIKQ